MVFCLMHSIKKKKIKFFLADMDPQGIKKKLSDDGIIYAEVPNLYGFPLTDESHKTTFTIYSLNKLFKEAGYNIIDYGYATTPKESLKLDYYYNNSEENIFIIATKNSVKKKVKTPQPIIPKSINNFKHTLFTTYAKIMVGSICLTLLKLSLRYFKTFILFFIYGILEIISLKILRFSLVNKIVKNIKKIFNF